MNFDFKEILQKYLNQSDHYLCGHLIESFEGAINFEGLVYKTRVENMCEATGIETIDIQLNDVLIWLYLRGEKE